MSQQRLILVYSLITFTSIVLPTFIEIVVYFIVSIELSIVRQPPTNIWRTKILNFFSCLPSQDAYAFSVRVSNLSTLTPQVYPEQVNLLAFISTLSNILHISTTRNNQPNTSPWEKICTGWQPSTHSDSPNIYAEARYVDNMESSLWNIFRPSISSFLKSCFISRYFHFNSWESWLFSEAIWLSI